MAAGIFFAGIEHPHALPWPEIEAMERELVRRNHIDQGMVYFQVTRGLQIGNFGTVLI